MLEGELETARRTRKSGSGDEETEVVRVESISPLQEDRELVREWRSACHSAGPAELRSKSRTTMSRHLTRLSHLPHCYFARERLTGVVP